MKIAYQASHEQFAPSYLLGLVPQVEEAGFDAIHSSDHFHPWNSQQGNSGFSFAWLGAAMQASSLPFSMVCAPGQRYHPAIVAQAIATLGEMFPGRFDVNLASGEAINECITGEEWPDKPARNARLLECAIVIRRLLQGEKVSHHGMVTVEDARLFTLPRLQPRLFGAAMTQETAKWMGSWADGLVTTYQPDATEAVITAFREGGGAGKPVHIKMDVSFDETEEAALQGAHEQWRTNVFPSHLLADTRMEQLEALGDSVPPEEMKQHVIIATDCRRYVEEIRKIEALGADMVILHNVNRKQEAFIRACGERVLPFFG